MIAEWVEEEMTGLELNDKRLDKRFKRVLTDLSQRPEASIPQASGGHAEMAAAYRLFDNPKTTAEKVLAPHIEATVRRVAAQPTALLVQDTTEADCTRPSQQVAGSGILDSGARRGVYLHAMHAFTPEGLPLGTVGADFHLRQEAPEEADGKETSASQKKKTEESDVTKSAAAEEAAVEGIAISDIETTASSRSENKASKGSDTTKTDTAKEKAARRKQTPIEEKESHRWVEGVRTAAEVARQCPDTTCVCVGDSESDIYEVFVEAQKTDNLHLLVRACQDRGLVDPAGKRLYDSVRQGEVLDSFRGVEVRDREAKVACEDRKRRVSRKPRMATVEVRAKQVTVRAPRRPDRKLPPVTMNAIMVSEVNAPEGEEPINWLLLTTLPIQTVAMVNLVIAYYAVRWRIEVFFRTLKTGCRIEKRLFEHVDRLLPCVATYMIVAWRTLYVCHMGRECPDAPCTILFDDSEWKPVWMATQKGLPLPAEPPRLQDMVHMVAQLGGYVNRPGRKDPPGAQTVWRGLTRTYDLAFAWKLFGPASPPGDV